MTKLLALRDFVYLDVERLKSIIAQSEEGLTTEVVTSKGRSQETDARAQGGLLGLLNAAGGLKLLWQHQDTETRTLHDNIYTLVEQALLNDDLLTKIPGDVTREEIEGGILGDRLGSTSFILAKGNAVINDYGLLREFMDDWNSFAKFVAWSASESQTMGMMPREKRKHQEVIEKAATIDRKLVEGIKLMFDLFYKERISVEVRPFREFPNFRLRGPLQERFLRDSIRDIIFKFGTSPVADWTIFAQIAAIPPQKVADALPPTAGSAIDLALQNVFSAFRGFEQLAQSIVFPEIAITPIALYRD